jgi:hypothetical protein
MPDSHNAKCESSAGWGMALDLIPDEIGRWRHIAVAEWKNWQNFGAG